MSQINETAIKTPGVYINEIPSFPPSVAQVSTAIPVFIGYTEKAIDAAGASLTKKPTKIFSLLEYIQYYGKAFNESDINIAITKTTVSGVVTSLKASASIASASAHNMYYSSMHVSCPSEDHQMLSTQQFICSMRLLIAQVTSGLTCML